VVVDDDGGAPGQKKERKEGEEKQKTKIIKKEKKKNTLFFFFFFSSKGVNWKGKKRRYHCVGRGPVCSDDGEERRPRGEALKTCVYINLKDQF
jgi:hypothetical protein